MKKVVLGLVLVTLLLSGCVKYEVGMEVKKDKSMDLSLVYAIASDLTENSDTYSSDEAKINLEKRGFVVNEYNEDDLTGIKAVKSIDNIDKVSSEKQVIVSLVDMLDENNEEEMFFKVEKGLSKNKYSASFIFDLTEDEESTDEESVSYDGYSNYFKFSYKITLPYKSISNNATNVSEDGKTLTWTAQYGKINDINFEFSMPNKNFNMLLFGGIGAILVIILAVTFLLINKNKKSNIKVENKVQKLEEMFKTADKNVEVMDIDL